MSRLLVLVLAGAVLAAAEPADPALEVVVQEFSYAQRVEFVLGNGEHPFADEDQRRAQVALQLRARGTLALLGWSNLSAQAVSDAGEPLALAGFQTEGVITASHDLKSDPGAPLLSLSLPLTRQPLRGLSRLEGAVDIRFSREAAQPERIALSALPLNQDHAIPGVEGGTLALTERGDNRLVFRFSPAAFLVVQDLVFTGADGKDLAGRNRRAEWRDNQGQLTYTVKTEKVAQVDVLVFRRVESRRVAFAVADLGLGMTVPGRDDLRGSVSRGAEGF